MFHELQPYEKKQTLTKHINENPGVKLINISVSFQNDELAFSESVENLSSPSYSTAEGPGTQPSDGGDPWTASPRKRTQTLPSRKCSFGSQGEAGGGRAGILNDDMWNLLGTSPPSSDPDKRTLSEDIFKILDLQRVSLFPSSTMSDESDRSATNGPEGKVTEATAAAKQTEIHSFKPKSLTPQTREIKSPRAMDNDESKAGGQEAPRNSLPGGEVELRKETERQKSLYEAHVSRYVLAFLLFHVFSFLEVS